MDLDVNIGLGGHVSGAGGIERLNCDLNLVSVESDLNVLRFL